MRETGRLLWRQRCLRVSADAVSVMLAYLVGLGVAVAVNELLLDRAFMAMSYEVIVDRTMEQGILAVLLMSLFASRGHYSSRHPFWTEARDVVIGVFLLALVDSSLQFAFKEQPSRIWLVASWLAAVPLILTGRLLIRKILHATGHWQLRTLMIGDGQSAEYATEALESEAYLGYQIVAHTTFAQFDPENADTAKSNSPLARAGGSVGHAIASIAGECGASFIVLAPSPEEFGQIDKFVQQLDRVRLSYAVVPPLRGIAFLSLEPQQFYSHDLMMLSFRPSLTSPVSRVIKRIFDIVVAGTGCLLLIPFFLICSIAIKWDGGPAFFRQQRVGKDGRIFECLKFRTMIIDADKRLAELLRHDPAAREEWERDHKLRTDPRITRIGAFLRRSSLDELPQIFNVLRGDMSLVGPRPIVQEELAKYGDNLDYYLSSLPGITGLWQVSGRNNTSYQRRVELDRWYIQNWSLWQDIAILCKTLPAVFARRGAY